VRELEPAAGRAGAVPRRRAAPGALRGSPERGRDQFVLPSAAQPRHVRTLGGERAATVPVCGEAAAHHHARAALADAASLLDDFLAQASGLGDRLECLLVQMPPSLAFDAATASSFFDALRERWSGRIAAEPRHASWFDSDVDGLLAQRGIARVLADPVRQAGGERPGGLADLVYLRLHGSPRVYYSSYAPEIIEALARRIALALQSRQRVWCIFDNTASGAATHDALALEAALQRAGGTAASDERR
jgi:uncharacterized protein YecE (DUF72 family)